MTLLLPDANIVFLDIETTDKNECLPLGISPEIVDIAGILVNRDLEILDTFNSTVCPIHLHCYTEECENFTGISKEIIESSPLWAKIWPSFAKFTRYNGARLACWSAPADFAILKTAYSSLGKGFPHSPWPLDVLSVYYSYCAYYGIGGKDWSLSSACERLGVPKEPEKHQALGGATALYHVMSGLVQWNV